LNPALFFPAVLILALAAILPLSPEAKLWLAEVIGRTAVFCCRELQARAAAQVAARAAWEAAYRQHRGAEIEAEASDGI
jgi:hypothetical protein